MADMSYLIGMPSRLTITDDMSHIIVKEGEIITQGVIRSAREAGRLDDLLMSAEMAARAPDEIVVVPEYEEIGEEEPQNVHPE